MLEVRELTKKYRNRAVVDHVSFTVPPGQVTGYLGPNGSGKSTTVKMLAGLLPPTHGKILWDGHDIRHDLIGFKRRLGYVPEEAFVYPHLTGLEHLELIGRLRDLMQLPSLEDIFRQLARQEDVGATAREIAAVLRESA